MKSESNSINEVILEIREKFNAVEKQKSEKSHISPNNLFVRSNRISIDPEFEYFTFIEENPWDLIDMMDKLGESTTTGKRIFNKYKKQMMSKRPSDFLFVPENKNVLFITQSIESMYVELILCIKGKYHYRTFSFFKFEINDEFIYPYDMKMKIKNLVKNNPMVDIDDFSIHNNNRISVIFKQKLLLKNIKGLLRHDKFVLCQNEEGEYYFVFELYSEHDSTYRMTQGMDSATNYIYETFIKHLDLFTNFDIDPYRSSSEGKELFRLIERKLVTV